MNFFSTLLAMAIAVVSVRAAVAQPANMAKACLADGAQCSQTGSMGACCSGFCLQEPGTAGVCTVIHRD